MSNLAWWNLLVLWLVSNSIIFPAQAQQAAADNTGRLEMQDKEIKGQRQGKNAVYLFERQKVQLQSMVKKPTSFRERILATVFDRS